MQDFRHVCQVLGGLSKCHICEPIECDSQLKDANGVPGLCNLQLQGVNNTDMSRNIPTLSDTAWAVGGSFRHDYGGKNVSHFCVFTSQAHCALPNTTDFTDCTVRCFGHGFKHAAVKLDASRRSVTDVYPGMGRWSDDGAVDLWSYPKNCNDMKLLHDEKCTFTGVKNQIPSYNPQGYVFTYAGSGKKGFVDGSSDTARFNGPEDVAVDENGVVFVADTQNNAIRMVDHDGSVTTLAGRGPDHPGYRDGDCSIATFVLPKGLDARHEIIDGQNVVVVLVADTGNHRIRRIVYNEATNDCTVSCLTGLCGNNSLSAAEFNKPATPLTGFADGTGLEARFSAPESVAFMDGDFFVVADTGNFLLRWVVASNGTTQTLAGTIIPGPKDPAGNPLPGCTPPCMVGQQGFRDGNLTFAEFYNPVDVTRGPNNTVWVADEQRIRIVELPNVITEFYKIKSMGRVSTIAGTSLQGHDDGIAQKSTFFYSSGVFVTADNIAYVVDAATCRVRRITPYPSVAEHITCAASAAEYIRPSGCTSFDQPVDLIGRKASRVERNIQYNFGYPYERNKDKGKYIKNCVGIPPHDKLDKRFVDITGNNLVIDDYRTAINEDSEQGMAILFNCPASCHTIAPTALVEGIGWYSESSSVCLAAIHDGKLTTAGGLVQIVLERKDYLVGNLSVHLNVNSTTQNGIRSGPIPQNVSRVFSIEPFNVSNSMVHTAAGNPSAPLESGCGMEDSLTPLDAMFSLPSGIAARYGFSLNDTTYIFIADAGNNRIRAISATCTQICENGGRCTGPDICTCSTGWTGVDCTKPVCSTSCGPSSLCVAPDVCDCKPGYSGANCKTPLCQQNCINGGTCIAPDTCGCAPGWFDTNCTTPVCDNTCANGGNCTAPGKCACPSEWTGADCRTPVCLQTCSTGYCVAPNTCACPPQYTGFDCSVPVCTQGYFQANGPESYSQLFPTTLRSSPTYKNCDMQSWCNATNEFECDQLDLDYGVIEVLWGPKYRAITGRKVAPTQCMNIELPINFKIPYQLIYADNTTTGHLRYSPISPYESNPSNAWRGYFEPTQGHTGPWTYRPDRQVANVNWLNVTQGLYVCANGGQCVAPDVCTCAPGWIGFDCRTPVCNQGYYFPEQEDYVSGLKTPGEVERFGPFFGNNSYTLDWNYSNPDFTIQYEFYEGPSVVTREIRYFNGTRYLGEANVTNDGKFAPNLQGGYRCTIRAETQWENVSYLFEHPNYFSQYMDTTVQKDGVTYTYWTNMSWPPTHTKSRVLDQYQFNWTFAYTNEGYRRQGIWTKSNNASWQYGVCVMEFFRDCEDPAKNFDLQSVLRNVYVQDTDLAFRPRITYNDLRVNSRGRWKQAGGSCIDTAIRGCANNGTCIAPDTCRCANGWSGSDCRVPVCEQTCFHHGNCTAPNVCTCERGWSGSDCRIPICAQECQNGGVCVAPDTCQCHQWPNTFRDGRVEGGRPLFQDFNGDPLYSGWTGFDCSVPICVQAEKFLPNVATGSASYVEMGGHGGDGNLQCIDSVTKLTLPRCPDFDEYVTANDGRSFQTGCGFDPIDTGCCDYVEDAAQITCYRCPPSQIRRVIQDGVEVAIYCDGALQVNTDNRLNTDAFKTPDRDFIILASNNYKRCKRYLSPRTYVDEPVADEATAPYGRVVYYLNPLDSSKNAYQNPNLTSNRFLCNVKQWIQGDYVDEAGLANITGAGSVYGLKKGRHVRINTPNILVNPVTQAFTRGPVIQGEGVYECYNAGSCIGPDYCTCTDGYEGDDCNTPLCRHLQVSGSVSSCLNGGICSLKDRCDCVQTDSVLWKVHPLTSRGLTGWTGSDCSMPICTQGYYDPFCGDLPQAPGGEGCYRCANNGNCTAPDVCTCAKGWTGFDCKTPVCEVVADPLTRTQLGTVFEDKVISFESDPCGVTAIYGRRGWKGTKYARGNCTQPDQCTCLCKVPYRRKSCHKTGKLCDGPWQDNMVATRNLPGARAPEFTFGTTDCYFGYEGNVDDMDHFTTCHQTIYVPTSTERDSLALIVSLSIIGFFALITYRYASARLKRRFLLAKIERRRTRRDSEASMQSGERSSLLRQSI